MAWCRQRMFDCYPIIGGANIERLKENIEALKVHLTDEQMEMLSTAVPFDLGFPYAGFFGSDPRDLPNGYPNSIVLNTVGRTGLERVLAADDGIPGRTSPLQDPQLTGGGRRGNTTVHRPELWCLIRRFGFLYVGG